MLVVSRIDEPREEESVSAEMWRSGCERRLCAWYARYASNVLARWCGSRVYVLEVEVELVVRLCGVGNVPVGWGVGALSSVASQRDKSQDMLSIAR